MASLNAFSVFGIKAEFKIDLGELERRYGELQRKVHPDAQVPQHDLPDAAQVNLAYKVLVDDLTRAFHLLELNGLKIESYKSNEVQELLEGIFEETEALEGLASPKPIQAFIDAKEIQVQKAIDELKKLVLPDDINAFAKCAIELKYLSNLLLAARGKLSF